VGCNGSRWFIALVLGLGAGVLPVAGSADTGPVPVDPPACVSVLPALTTSCPQAPPSRPQPQAGSVSSAQSTQSSQARAFRVSATPDLAQTLLAAVNRTRRAHGLRPLAYSGALANAATEHARALATAGMFTHEWGLPDASSRAGSAASIQRTATGRGAPAKTCSGHRRDSRPRARCSSGSTAPLIADCS
jgi:hypothetical protein